MKRKTMLTLGLVATLGVAGAVAIPAVAGGWGPFGGGCGPMADRGQMMHGPMMHGPMVQGARGHGPAFGMGPTDSAIYRGFDANTDGTVTADEAQAGVKALHAKHDADGNGTLSAEEFGTLFAEATQGFSARPFAMLDADGNGELSADEMTFPARMMAMRTQAQGWFGWGAPAHR